MVRWIGRGKAGKEIENRELAKRDLVLKVVRRLAVMHFWRWNFTT